LRIFFAAFAVKVFNAIQKLNRKGRKGFRKGRKGKATLGGV